MISSTDEKSEFSPVNSYLRNPFRILNHMPLINKKIKQGRKWSLVDSGNGANKDKHQLVMNVLSNFAAYTINVPEALNEITSINGCAGARDEIDSSLLECYSTGLLEFHATDKCDLDCIDCHYRNKGNASIPFKNIEQIAKRLKASAITITGGGEPTVYADKGKHFSDVVFVLRRALPTTKLGLINNNTVIPRGEWASEIEWQRSSLDAASANTYFEIKRRDLFDTVVRNIKKLLLESSVPFVGVGFLYREENVHELNMFLHYWHCWLLDQTASVQQRFNIQFRPISPAIDDVQSIRITNNFPDKKTIETVKDQAKLTRKDMMHDTSFAEFVRIKTNFVACFGTEDDSRNLFVHHPVSFDKCYNALTHRVFRANGDEYSDFLLCNHPELKLGNAQNGNINSLLGISLMEFYYFNRKGPFCSGEDCRQGWVNQCVEQYQQGLIAEEALSKITHSFFY